MNVDKQNFIKVLAVVALVYIGLLLAMVLANVTLVASDSTSAWGTLARPEIQQAILLSLGTSLLSAVLSLWIGTGIAYFVSREKFLGRLTNLPSAIGDRN